MRFADSVSASSVSPSTKSPSGEPALVAEGLTKWFGHVQALQGADFECYPGKVTALIGDNGAGKSTLVKILSGALAPDGGRILVSGREYRPNTPTAAHAFGVETVYQDLALAPDLGPAQNLFLGREQRKSGVLGRLGFLNDRGMREEAARQFEELGVALDPRCGAVRALSGGQRQGVAVARAVTWAKSIVLLDEPTAALGVVQTRNVLALVRRVAASGRAVVLVSHSMPDVLEVADTIEVLRLGRRVAQFDRGNATVDRLVAAMTGGGTTGPDSTTGAL
jgi:simple sugar transport system ATP-binding protein